MKRHLACPCTLLIFMVTCNLREMSHDTSCHMSHVVFYISHVTCHMAQGPTAQHCTHLRLRRVFREAVPFLRHLRESPHQIGAKVCLVIGVLRFAEQHAVRSVLFCSIACMQMCASASARAVMHACAIINSYVRQHTGKWCMHVHATDTIWACCTAIECMVHGVSQIPAAHSSYDAHEHAHAGHQHEH
jgi:hypothetical protein